MLNARESRGRLAMRRLASEIGCENVNEAFSPDIDGFRSPPLSWYIDQEMLDRMRRSTIRILEDVKKSDRELLANGSGSIEPNF
jgi:hypothetical protein